MQGAALRRHHVGVHAPLSVEATIITYDTGRIHAHTLILSASCIPVNVRSVPLSRRSPVTLDHLLCGTEQTLDLPSSQRTSTKAIDVACRLREQFREWKSLASARL